MDKKVKRKWLRALRSGEYDQTKNFLCTTDEEGNDSFCCLGVLLNEMDVEFSDPVSDVFYGDDGMCEILASAVDDDDGTSYHETLDSKTTLYGLPRKIREGLGISETQAETLAEMNDAGDSFIKIAKHIEKKL